MFCPIRLSEYVYQRIIVVYSLKYRGAIETMEYCHAASSFRDVHTYKIRLKVFFVFVFVFVFFQFSLSFVWLSVFCPYITSLRWSVGCMILPAQLHPYLPRGPA